MPICDYVTDKAGDEKKLRAYVPGKTISRHQVRALKRFSSGTWYWYHDSFLPPLRSFAWIVPLHLCFTALIYLFLTADKPYEYIWFGGGTALMALFMSMFWTHMYFNTTTRQLHQRQVIPDLSKEDRWRYLARGYVLPTTMRPSAFSAWLYDQLKAVAPHFGAVSTIIESYVAATNRSQKLLRSLPREADERDELDNLLKTASDTAYEQLRPIFEKDMQAKAQAEREAQAKIVSETKYRQGEEKRITNQRVQMASEDVNAYIQGHTELAQNNIAA